MKSMRVPAFRLVVMLFVIVALVACEPEVVAAFAVYTGGGWQTVQAGRVITTYRDNPPLTGLLVISPGEVLDTPGDSPYHQSGNRSLVRSLTWNFIDWRLNGSFATFHDAQNDGYVGISPEGPLPSRRLPLARWHSNGMLLRPGQVVDIQLQRRTFVGQPYTGRWLWQSVPGVEGQIMLAQNTIVVGVTLIVVRNTGESMLTDRALAELWLDGRTVYRLAQSLSSGGSLNSYIVDHDPRLTWNASRFDDPNEGRSSGPLVQEADAVWSFCGINYDKNIQFRLVSYKDISFSDVPGFPGVLTLAAIGHSRMEYWVANAYSYVRRLDRVPADAAPTIPVVVVKDYSSMGGVDGVAEAFRQGIIFGEDSFGNIGARHPETTLAHEFGHVLGYPSPLFADGAPGVTDPVARRENLMSTGAPQLTREQCDLAYGNARQFAVR